MHNYEKEKLRKEVNFSVMQVRYFLVSLCFLISCASPGAGPGGHIYSNVKLGIFATGEKSMLQGKSCIHSILGLFAIGNASIGNIKTNSGIINVTDVNWEMRNYLGLYASLCVIVGGKK